MSHPADAVTIDSTLHNDLRKMAGTHPAAQIATSPLAKALAADTTPGQIVNSTLTAYLSAIEQGALPKVTDTDRQALIARAQLAFPGR